MRGAARRLPSSDWRGQGAVFPGREAALAVSSSTSAAIGKAARSRPPPTP